MVIDSRQCEWKPICGQMINTAAVVVQGCDEVVILPNGKTITGITGVLEIWHWPVSNKVKTQITSEAEYYAQWGE